MFFRGWGREFGFGVGAAQKVANFAQRDHDLIPEDQEKSKSRSQARSERHELIGSAVENQSKVHLTPKVDAKAPK